MMAAIINRQQLKADTKSMLATARVSPKAMIALYLGITIVLDLIVTLIGDLGLASTFISILIALLLLVLDAGFVLYCMDIRRGETSGFLTLFDGFSFVGKLIGLHLVIYVFVFLWSMLFVIPGIIAGYRYRFAVYNLCENPELGIFEALNMSKQQTMGYKTQLFMLDLSYIGWTILADLPATIYSSYFQIEAVSSAMSVYALEGLQPTLATPGFLPLWGWYLLTGLWHLAVAIFYLSNRYCVELGYFEIAKETSGIGPRPSQQDFSRNDSDDTNGFY